MEFINALCALVGQYHATDVFLHEGKTPQFRIDGGLVPVQGRAITKEDMDAFWTQCGAQPEKLDFDCTFVSSDGTRFRVNLFRSLYERGAVLRPIKTVIPTLESLGLPANMLTSWVVRSSGLILVCGPTGGGKSTTMASTIDWLNQRHHRHIVTIEDPVEYLFTPQCCLFTQREVGTDTTSFEEGLRRAMRQSPNVIVLGEIRDSGSAATALRASETGHLVIASLHGSNVLDALERLTNIFEVDQRDSILQLLSKQLIGVLCQKLIPALPEGRAVLVEYFENVAVTRKWIRENRFGDLSDFLTKDGSKTNNTFLKALVDLVKSGRISEAVGIDSAPNPHELQRVLRGIDASSVTR